MQNPFPAYRGDEPYVFVCYAHEDSAAVYSELAWLRDQGVNVWYDEGISAGANWRASIGDALLGARYVLAYISPRLLASNHCNREINLALDEDKDLIPIYLEEVELTSDLRVGLNRVQALHPRADARYRAHLLEALGHSGADSASRSESHRTNTQGKLAAALGIAIASALLIAGGWWLWPANVQVPAPADHAHSRPTEAELPATSVAVLPFVNMSNDAEQEFFSDGISEDILNALAKNASLIVRPRSSSFSLKKANLDLQAIGDRLAVTHVLEGSVRRAGNRVRVTAQLSEVAGNRSVWSERYDRELNDVFAVQDAVVNEILTALNAQLDGAGTPRYVPGIEAYDAFLLGRDYFTKSQFDLSDQWLETAVRIDPDYAEAWAFLAQNIAWRTALGMNPSTGEHALRRRQYIEKALALDPSNATALGTRALTETLYAERDYEAAVNDLITLVTNNPNNTAAHFYLVLALATVGRSDLALRVSERLARLAPGSMLDQSTYVDWFVRTAPLDGAQRSVRDFYAKFDYPMPAIELAMRTGDVAALRDALDRGSRYLGPVAPFYRALVPYLTGDFEKAQQAIAPLRSAAPYRPYLARFRVALIDRDLDAAFDYYYQAVEAAEPGAIAFIQGDFQSMRGVFPEFYADPRYARMLKDFGVDPESVAQMEFKELPF